MGGMLIERMTAALTLLAVTTVFGACERGDGVGGKALTLCIGLDSYLTGVIHRVEEGDERVLSPDVPNLLLQRFGFCVLVRDVSNKDEEELSRLVGEFGKIGVRLSTRLGTRKPGAKHSQETLDDLRALLTMTKRVNSFPIK